MKANVDIFSGFLGAGKTMLIKKLLNEKAYGKNTIIIENEFGEVGIDGDILKESNIEIKEINSGCICCQVSGNFSEAILEVINKYSPENIIIEPSGVAKLSEILNILQSIKFQEKLQVRNIVTVIDIRNYKMYLENFKEFYVNQIKKANKIVLSRSQLTDEATITHTIDSIKKLNANAEIIYKSWDTFKAKDCLELNYIKGKTDISLIKNPVNKSLRREESHDAKDMFENYPIEIHENTSIQDIQKKFEYINNNEKFGNILRAKGFFCGVDGEYYQFDYVPNEFKSRKIRWSNKKVVSIIGCKLNKDELLELFKK